MSFLVPASCIGLALLAGGCTDSSRTATPSAAAVITSSASSAALQSPSPPSPSSATGAASNAPPIASCASYRLEISTTSVGHRPRHTAAEALIALKKAGAGPAHRTAVVLTRMAIPLAEKVGLGSPSRLRLVWIIYGTDTVTPRPPGSAGPREPYPVGTVLPVFWIVDDSTLQLGGTYGCSGHLPGVER